MAVVTFMNLDYFTQQLNWNWIRRKYKMHLLPTNYNEQNIVKNSDN